MNKCFHYMTRYCSLYKIVYTYLCNMYDEWIEREKKMQIIIGNNWQ